jgi:hypothetical protein
VAGVAGFYAGNPDANALPMFARRYGVPCSTCHTSPPRLNETGYQFRAAGFRMPNEIGQKVGERQFKINQHLGFRLQPRYDVTRTSVGAESDTVQKVNLFAAEGYIWYAPISSYFSSNVKLTIWPDESDETELTERLEGTLRFDYGKPDNFVDIRVGVPHPHEGFGGSESYVASDTRPFIQELKTANFNQDTFFTPLGFHQAGLTVGYYHKRTTLRGQLTTGIRLREHDGELEPFGRKDPIVEPISESKGGPDFHLFFNQILHPDGGNVSVFYYNGRSYLPRLDLLPPGATGGELESSTSGLEAQGTATASRWSGASYLPLRRPPDDPLSRSLAAGARMATSAEPAEIQNVPFFKNSFQRLALYAGYPIKRVRLLAGVQGGKDSIGSGGHFFSAGQFVEAMVNAVNDISAVGVRYDWFDPSRNKDQNDLHGFTAYLNVWLHGELRITPEYQHIVTNQGSGLPERREDRFQLRLYWVK